MVRAGFSIVEVIVALVLLSVGVLGVAGSGLLAAELLRQAEAREAMVGHAGMLLDSLLARGTSDTGFIALPRYRLEWIAAPESVIVTARLPKHADLVLKARR